MDVVTAEERYIWYRDRNPLFTAVQFNSRGFPFLSMLCCTQGF
jgi:hypothetical protein